MDTTIPPDAFLASYPPRIRQLAQRLRVLVRRALPDVVERVRPGWSIVGFDVLQGHRQRYAAFVLPESEHVHLGFAYGAWMHDPEGVLEGAHLRLRQVRFLTYEPGDRIDARQVIALTREAARLAVLSPAERAADSLDRGWDRSRQHT